MELKNRVVLNDEDIKMIEDFFYHYNDQKKNNLIMTELLRKEMNIFKEKSTVGTYNTEDQRRFTIALCGALSDTTHPLLRDEEIKDVLTACSEVWTDAQFYEEFEKAIQVPKVKD